jgi:hypothetical protein
MNASEPERSILLLPSLSLPRFLTGLLFRFQAFCMDRVPERRFPRSFSETLDKVAAAQESNNSKQIISSLKELQEMKCVDANGLDDALKTHLLIKSKHKSRCNPVQVVKHMLSLSEANPVKFQAPGHLGSDKRLNQFMRT